MPNLDYIIEVSNLEKVRTKIAFILADELANQKTLIEALPAPDQEEQLTLESIPAKVFEERFIRVSEGESIMLNVMVLNNPLSANTSIESQQDNARYIIEAYATGKSSSIIDGDYQAAVKMERLLMMCRHILMSPYYFDLGFADGVVSKRTASDFEIIQPDDGIDVGYVIRGQFSLIVNILEPQTKITGISLTSSYTEQKQYDTEKGYFYEI